MIATAIAAATHFETQMAPRDTGLEATQARVPLSRSTTSRLIEAKIATTTAICVPTAVRKFAERIEGDRFGRRLGAGNVRDDPVLDRSRSRP